MSALDRLACFRGLYCVWIAAAVAWQWREHARWVRIRAERRRVPVLLGRWPMPPVGVRGFHLTAIGLLVGLGLAAWAPANPAGPLAVASLAALLYFAQVVELPAVKRKANSVPAILFLLGVAGCSGDSEIAAACLFLVKATVAQLYLSSAIAKLRDSGGRWVRSDTLRIVLLRYALRDDNRAALWLARRGRTCRWLALCVLAFELSFWLAIPFPTLAWILVPAGVLFHVGVAATMRIHYWIYVFPAYLAFVVAP